MTSDGAPAGWLIQSGHAGQKHLHRDRCAGLAGAVTPNSAWMITGSVGMRHVPEELRIIGGLDLR